jgi:hypothetical protein
VDLTLLLAAKDVKRTCKMGKSEFKSYGGNEVRRGSRDTVF